MKYSAKEKACYMGILLLAICTGIIFAFYKVHINVDYNYNSSISKNLDRVSVEVYYKAYNKDTIHFKGYIDKDDYRNYMTSSDGNYILSLYKHRTDLDRCDVIVANSITDFKVNFKEEE